MKFEHLGIAVADLEAAKALFTKLFNTAPYREETVETEGVRTSFFRTGEGKMELLAATRADSPIAKFLEKKGPGMHHVAFEVEDIKAEMQRLKVEGFTLLSEEPRPGAEGKWVCFLHPKDTNSVLIELCQQIPA